MVLGKLEERRLEVVVLGARSLPEGNGEGRRKVQLSLVTAGDPEGQLFGVKASPWTEPVSSSRGVRFGRSGQGLTCSFALSGSSAPGITGDPRFAEKARLRARLLCSRVPVNAAFKTMAGMLPSNFASGMVEELDEATAQVEAEALVPLANIVSGRIGFHADRALGGWIPLIPTNHDGAEFDAGMDSDRPPMSIWMQMYVLPDHEKMLPDIQGQFAEELYNGRKGPAPKVRTPMASPSQAAKDFAQVAASVGAQPRWGPKRPPTAAGAAGTSAEAAVDLLGFEDQQASGGCRNGDTSGTDLLDFDHGNISSSRKPATQGEDDLLDVGRDAGTDLLFEASSPSTQPTYSSNLNGHASNDLLGANTMNLLEPSPSYDSSLLSFGTTTTTTTTTSGNATLSQPSGSLFAGTTVHSAAPPSLFSGLTTSTPSASTPTLPAAAAGAAPARGQSTSVSGQSTSASSVLPGMLGMPGGMPPGPSTAAGSNSNSAFSFISGGASASSTSAAGRGGQAAASPAAPSSAFSFISQGGTPGSSSSSPSAGLAANGLDLKSLYEASGRAPTERRQETSNYSALSDFDLRLSMQQSSAKPGPISNVPKSKPASSLQGLEANLVAGLSSSLRS
mmetsp:Transcript_65568/g.137063  ORF Transcript_65568/g.137063 Transcript_65568/m.137063 type:complete len:619 (+) Transcript_65568:36-1892(+)